MWTTAGGYDSPLVLKLPYQVRCRECRQWIEAGAESIGMQHKACWETNYCWDWREAQKRQKGGK